MDDILNINEMDQDMLKTLFEEGGIFIFLEVPEGTEFGVDMKIWNIAEKFKGVKMIPPGLHFIHYSSVDSYGDVGSRFGFFHNFKRGECLVKKWNKAGDDASPISISEEESIRFKENIKNLDKYLGCYPYDIYPRWVKLSHHLNDNLVKKLTPKCGIIRAAVDLVACNDADRPRGKIESGESSASPISKLTFRSSHKKSNTVGNKDHLLPDLKAVEGTEIQFTKFPERHYPEGATPSEITQHSLDYSYLLQCLVDQHETTLDFLGEIQFAYICFLIGGSLDAFDHWKELIGVVCSCQKAITKYRILYDNLTEMLEVQIAEIPEDFLVDIVANNNFIYVKIRSLLRYVFESDIDGRLKSKVGRFKQRIVEKYNWDLNNVDVESDDEAPVIVELTSD